MTVIETLKLLGAAGGAFGATKLWDFMIARRKQNSSDLSTVVDLLKEDNEELRRQRDEYTYEIEVLRKEVADLRMRLSGLEGANMDVPIPMWMKDTRGVMLNVNHSFEDHFLRPLGKQKHEYIGNPDAEVWPEESARKFRESDMQCLQEEKTITAIETLDLGLYKEDHMIIKYPRYIDGIKVGVVGMAVKINLDEIGKKLQRPQ